MQRNGGRKDTNIHMDSGMGSVVSTSGLKIVYHFFNKDMKFQWKLIQTPGPRYQISLCLYLQEKNKGNILWDLLDKSDKDWQNDGIIHTHNTHWHTINKHMTST